MQVGTCLAGQSRTEHFSVFGRLVMPSAVASATGSCVALCEQACHALNDLRACQHAAQCAAHRCAAHCALCNLHTAVHQDDLEQQMRYLCDTAAAAVSYLCCWQSLPQKAPRARACVISLNGLKHPVVSSSSFTDSRGCQRYIYAR